MQGTESKHVKGQMLVLLVTSAYFFVELFDGLYYHSIALVTDASFMAVNISGQIIGEGYPGGKNQDERVRLRP